MATVKELNNYLERLPAELLVITMEKTLADFLRAFPCAIEDFKDCYKRIILAVVERDMPHEIKKIFKCIIVLCIPEVGNSRMK